MSHHEDMQLISLDPDLFGLVWSGEKVKTTRKGIKPYRLGIARFVDPDNKNVFISINITNIRCSNWSHLRKHNYLHMAEGYKSRHQFHRRLRHYYGELEDSSYFTVVDFEVV